MRSSASRPSRALATLAGVALAAAAAWLASGGHRALRPLLEGPEAGARRALAALGASAPFEAGALSVARLRFRDPLVTAGDGAVDVVAVADAEGSFGWRGERVAVSYLGRERLRVVRCPGAGWCVEGGALPRLAALLETLSERAAAFDGASPERYAPLISESFRGPDGDGRAELLARLAADLRAGATARLDPVRGGARLRPLAWQVRIERETAQVGEDYEIALGAAPPRRLRARLDLREEGGGWRFTGGL